MSKYAPLTAYLRKQPYREVRLGFRDLEKILGFSLPSSACQHRAWWSNNGSNNVMTKAWLSAGYRTRDVDMDGERLTFERTGAAAPDPETPPTTSSPRPPDDLALVQRVLEVLRGDDEQQAQKLRRAIMAALATPKTESALDIFASDLPEDAFEGVFPNRREKGWREIDL
ncbi:DUF7662 domain-containing protein [Methylocystis hirsuta]|uniref:DUF7662 domain-containing protein n=1 Tax=Methylocystis hirsuta TaxID=369798 RepID=A0A3M9XQ14_9HYPH|nr:hypothetical protein [Methylocystis hirsuta]RNJ49842.1 hypothetical protein D1O30_09780 [Methylocystis hirsuta]